MKKTLTKQLNFNDNFNNNLTLKKIDNDNINKSFNNNFDNNLTLIK